MSNIVFLIPCTSRNCDYKTVDDSMLYQIFYESVKKFDVTRYKFIVGFDDNDEFYLREINNLKKILPDNFYFYFYNNYDKSYSCVVNQLANTAIIQFDAEFLHLVADDLYIYNLDYIDVFSKFIKSNNNIGLGQPVDKTSIKFNHESAFDRQFGICTHPFVHVNHVKYLGYFIPPQIKNWFCDNWITQVYRKLNKFLVTCNYVIENKIDSGRYDISIVKKEDLNKFVDDAIKTISDKMNE